MSDVFISYRREDGSDFSEYLSMLLENIHCSFFYDKTSLIIGDKFPDRLEAELRNCNDVVLVISKTYFGINAEGKARINDSEDWVRREVLLALENKKHIIPILIDNTIFPKLEELPEDIKDIVSIQYMTYSSQFKLNKFEADLEKNLSDETKNNIKYGGFLQEIKEIGSENNNSFTAEIKRIIKNITGNDIQNYFLSMLESNDIILKHKFVVYYTIYTYYRRFTNKKIFYKFIEKYSDMFSKFTFNNIVMTQYYRFKFEDNGECTDNLDMSLKYAQSALGLINNNFGVYLTYAELVTIGLDYDFKKYRNLTLKAIDSIEKADFLEKDYSKVLFIHGKLLFYQRKYKLAEQKIKEAIDLEDSTHKDYYNRIIQYTSELIAMKGLISQRKERKKMIFYIIVNDIFVILLISIYLKILTV